MCGIIALSTITRANLATFLIFVTQLKNLLVSGWLQRKLGLHEVLTKKTERSHIVNVRHALQFCLFIGSETMGRWCTCRACAKSFFFSYDSVNPNIFFLGNSIQIFNKMLLEFENWTLPKNKLEIGHVLVLYNISPSGGRVWVRIVPHLHQVFYTLIQ